jgi:hypothetical protein
MAATATTTSTTKRTTTIDATSIMIDTIIKVTRLEEECKECG